MEKNIVIDNIKNWLLKYSYTGFKFNDSHFEIIYETTEKYISNEEKKAIELWLEYFLMMNFAKDRFLLIDDLVDVNFFEEKYKAIINKKYENFVICVLIKAAITEVFENNLTFDEKNFVMNIDKLSEQLKIIIKNEFQAL